MKQASELVSLDVDGKGEFPAAELKAAGPSLEIIARVDLEVPI